MADEGQPLQNLVLPDGTLDRDAGRRRDPELLANLLSPEAATAVVELRGGRAETTDRDDDGGRRLLLRTPHRRDGQWFEDGGLVLYLGKVGEWPVVAILRGEQAEADGPAFGDSVRQVGLALPEQDMTVFLTALALFHWHERHPHCPRCGGATTSSQSGWVRVCEVDGSEHFPRTDPAVIMAVVDADDRLLLARGTRWDGPQRSVLAGFVEPGETFEQAVARETLEESGVVVDEVTYVGNQPWPFPASLMIGFMARARTLELTPEAGEIEEIGWYTRADVDAGLANGTLRLPGRLSIARALIERWYGGRIAAKDFS